MFYVVEKRSSGPKHTTEKHANSNSAVTMQYMVTSTAHLTLAGTAIYLQELNNKDTYASEVPEHSLFMLTRRVTEAVLLRTQQTQRAGRWWWCGNNAGDKGRVTGAMMTGAGSCCLDGG